LTSEEQFLNSIRENQGIILKLVSLYMSDEEEKKDLYNEILLQAWKAWPSFRGDAKFSTWLYKISLNTIFTQKRKVQKIEYTDSLETISPMIYAKPNQEENSHLLKTAIRLLAETDIALITLHLDGYDHPEIAEMMGISINHVAVKLHRIKQQLIKIINPE
jgi:RNA polymerase sigma-70 factor (ECF subfamily)